MNSKHIAILFLIGVIIGIFSTDEHVKKHHNYRKLHHALKRSNIANYHHHNRNHHQSKIANRDLSPEALELYFNQSSDSIAFVNATANTAIIFSTSSSHVLLLSGENGNGIGIDGTAHTLLKLSNVWTTSNLNFGEFYQLLDLQSLVKSGQQISEEDSKPELNRLASHLEIEDHVLEILIGASKLLNEIHPIINVLLKPNHFKVKGTVIRSVTVFKGIADFFSEKPQELEEIIKKGAKIDLPSVFNAPNGPQAFLRLLQSLSANKVNIAELAGSPLKNLETVLKIMVELGGNDHDNGVDNVIVIVYNIVALINGHGCLDNLIAALIKAGEKGGVQVDPSDITPIIEDLLKLAEMQNSMFRSGSFLSVPIKFFRDFNSNNFVFMNDINISELLHLLQEHDFKGAIDMIVKFFVHFNNIINPTKSLPRFFGYLLTYFNTTRGCSSIPQFLPGIDPNQIQLFKQMNFQHEVMQAIQQRNMAQIEQLPVVGHVYTNCSEAVTRNGNLDFGNMLSQTGGTGIFPPFALAQIPLGIFATFVSAFTNFFKPFLGIGGESNPLQNFANFNPLQSFGNLSFLQGLAGGNGIPGVGQLAPQNITNIIVTNTVTPSTNETSGVTEPVIVSSPLTVETTTQETVQEARAKEKHHHAHARKESGKHHIHSKHHSEHSKHSEHEKSHAKTY